MSPCRIFLICLFALSWRGAAQETPVALRTGVEGALTSFEVKLDLSPVRRQVLSLDFGFSTAESPGVEGFLDSFSITLQRTNGSATALLGTVDRLGLQLAPENPGGLVLNSNRIWAESIPGANVAGVFDYHLTYRLNFEIPAALGGVSSLFFDLFSNENGLGSLGYFRNIKVSPPPFAVQSASVFNGAFTDEPEAVLDFVAGTIEVPLVKSAQFFRVKGAAPVSLKLTSVTTNELRFDFEFRPARLALMGAADVTGPFSALAATIDLSRQTISVPLASEATFFWIDSDLPVRVGAIRVEGALAVIEFAFDTGPMVLQSSQLAAGPFVDCPDAIFVAASRSIRTPRIPSTQVFRLNGELEYLIRRIERRANSWLMHFE